MTSSCSGSGKRPGPRLREPSRVATAAAATLDYAFDALGWDDVIHCIAPDNQASAASTA